MTEEIRSRRFIAGARCPECDAQDRIQRIEKINGEVLMNCLACGMVRSLDAADTEARPAGHQSAPVLWRNGRDKP